MAAAMIPPAAAPEFLARAGWGAARIEPLAGDASFRRYFRVVEPGRQAVLMDAPPPHEDPRPFLAVAAHLSELGFATPEIYAQDLDHGLVLLQDFGDDRLREAVEAAPATEHDTYADAVTLLTELHRHPPANLPPYSRAELHREAGLLTDWYAPAIGLKVDAAGYVEVWNRAFNALDDAPQVTVLRDYHAENIMLRAGHTGSARLGLLDFQDALVGHPAYDLVSLLQDARRDVAPELETAMRDRYRLLGGDVPGFDEAYAILGAQRNAKILGIFTRLWQRDGKPRYLKLLPRVWRYLERDLEHPALAGVRAWFDLNIASDRRADAWHDR